GCAPGVRTICSSVRFQSTTGCPETPAASPSDDGRAAWVANAVPAAADTATTSANKLTVRTASLRCIGSPSLRERCGRIAQGLRALLPILRVPLPSRERLGEGDKKAVPHSSTPPAGLIQWRRRPLALI